MKLLERVKTVTFIRELLPILTNSRWGLLAITRVSISLHNPSSITICVHRDSANNEHSEFSEMVKGVGGSVGASVGGIVGITGWGVGVTVGMIVGTIGRGVGITVGVTVGVIVGIIGRGVGMIVGIIGWGVGASVGSSIRKQ